MTYRTACLLSWGIGWLLSAICLGVGLYFRRKDDCDPDLVALICFVGVMGLVAATPGFLATLPNAIAEPPGLEVKK